MRFHDVQTRRTRYIYTLQLPADRVDAVACETRAKCDNKNIQQQKKNCTSVGGGERGEGDVISNFQGLAHNNK